MSFKLSLRAMTNLVEYQIWRHGFVCFRVEYLVFKLYVTFKYDVNFSRVCFFFWWRCWRRRSVTFTPTEFLSWTNNWHGMYKPIVWSDDIVRCSITTSYNPLKFINHFPPNLYENKVNQSKSSKKLCAPWNCIFFLFRTEL